jgi:tetratricopeptide (TPR) repeat protein
MRTRRVGGGNWLEAMALAAVLASASAARASEACPESAAPGGLASMDTPIWGEYQQRRSALESLLARKDAPAPEVAEASGRLGEWFHAFAYYAEATACYAQAQRLAPSESRWPYLMGQIALRTGDFDGARERFEQALKLSPENVATLVDLAEAELKLERLEEAEPLLHRALAAEPKCVAALAALGRVQLARGDFDAAIGTLEEALRLQPSAVGLHYPLGLAYRGKGDLERARTHMSEANVAERRKTPPALDNSALRPIAELKALGAQTHKRRGLAALKQHRPEEAVVEMRAAIEASPDDDSMQVELGTALLEAGRTQDGVEQLESVLERWPNQARAHYLLGVVSEKQGRLPEAAQRYEAAIAADAGMRPAHERLGAVLLQQGRFEEALTQFQTLADRDPGSAQARFMVANVLLNLGRYGEARPALEQALGLARDQEDVQLALARLLAAAPQDGVRDGARALELSREAFRRHHSLFSGQTVAMAYAELGKFDEAARWQTQAVAEAERAGAQTAAELARQRLGLYQAHQPCRAPFAPGERPEPGRPAGEQPEPGRPAGEQPERRRP